VLKRILILLCLSVAALPLLRAQEIPTETRAGELQLGGGYSIANPDYSPHRFYGPYLYGTFDFRDHIGVEFDFHQVSEPSKWNEGLYERTYQAGIRYVWHYKRLDPYVRGTVGRGVFNYANNSANLAYDLWSLGGGLDIRTTRYLNVRLIDYDYQTWTTFSPNNLEPRILSFGAAYRFH